MLAFVQSAALWLLIEAEFLAIALVLVYVGAVMVLFLFVVMMLDINVEKLREGFTRYLPLGTRVALVVVVEIGHVIWFRCQGFAFAHDAEVRHRRATATRRSSARCCTRSTCTRSRLRP